MASAKGGEDFPQVSDEEQASDDENEMKAIIKKYRVNSELVAGSHVPSIWQEPQDVPDQSFQNAPFRNEEESFQVIASRMSNVTENGLVKKRILSTGLETYGTVPDHGFVKIHYTLFTEDEIEPFDCTFSRGKPAVHFVDVGLLIPGFEEALKSMKKKEKSEFYINYLFAFGEMGCPPRVPPKADLLAVVEMIDFGLANSADGLKEMDINVRNQHLSFEKLEEMVARELMAGNAFVDQKEWKLAAKRYNVCRKLMEEAAVATAEKDARRMRILLKCYLNLGLCFIKIFCFKKACINLQEALKIEPDNVKGNYRLGLAKMRLGDESDAMKYLKKAQRLSPLNATIGNEIAALDKQIRADRANMTAFCYRMFGIGPKERSQEADEEPFEPSEELVQLLQDFKLDTQKSQLYLPKEMTPKEVSSAAKLAESQDLKLVCDETGKTKAYKIVKD